MAYYDALITKWATLAAGSTGDKLAVLNAMTAPGPVVDVPISDVVGYLSINGKLSGLMDYAAAPPSGSNPVAVIAAKELSALIQSPNAGPFRMTRPDVYAGIQTFLNALAFDAKTGITTSDVTNILALAQPLIPWW